MLTYSSMNTENKERRTPSVSKEHEGIDLRFLPLNNN